VTLLTPAKHLAKPRRTRTHTHAAKTLWKAQTAELEWGPNASGLLVAAKTDVDKSGKSYYGSTTLHFVSPRAAPDAALALGTRCTTRTTRTRIFIWGGLVGGWLDDAVSLIARNLTHHFHHRHVTSCHAQMKMGPSTSGAGAPTAPSSW
jgi:hypothetical protein